MKPAFALDLDNDAVRLLGRSDGGWFEVGRADLGAPDLDAEMTALRARAAALAPEGWVSKLILPQSQILYTEVDAPSNNRASQRADIVNALKGRTPYPVSELVFDWSRTGSLARVAVVARITLDEAEAFAEAHGFNPVAFVAVPPAGKFGGEPFFGTTAQAAAHLPPGARLDRDQDPVRVVEAAALPEVRTDAPELEAEAVAIDESLAPAEAPPEIEVAAEAAQVADHGAGAEDVADPIVVAEAATEEQDAGPAEDEAATEVPEDEPATEAPRSAGADTRAPLVPEAAPEPEPEADEAPFIAVDLEPQEENLSGLIKRLHAAETDPAPAFQTRRALVAERPEDEEDLRRAEHRLHLLTPDPVPDLPAPRIAAGMAAITAPVLDVPSPLPDDAEPAGFALRRLRGAGRAALGAIPDAAHGTLAQRNFRHGGPPRPPLAAPVATTGAAAKRDKPARRVAPVAGRKQARRLIVLSALLILAMLAVALGSLVFSGDHDAAPPAVLAVPAPEETPESAPPGASDASGADVIPPSDSSDSTPDVVPAEVAPPAPTDTATGPVSAPQSSTDAAVSAALADPAADSAATAEAPPPTVSAPRDVPLNALAALPQPEADAPGAPSIAEVATGADGFAGPADLPAAAGAVADAPPAPQPLPPPFGTVVTFGPGGLIVPTPDGVITPGGFTLFAGKPPLLPPARPGSAAPATAPAVAPDTVAPDAAPDAAGTADPATAAPGDGATAPEAAPTVAPATALAPAGPRPAARPQSVVAAALQARRKAEALAEAAVAAAKAEAERIASATPQAVASSRRPASRPSRPGGFATAVDAAVADAVAAAVAAPAPTPEPTPAPAAIAAKPAPAPEPTAAEEIDEPEPVAMLPNRSTSVTVARQATVKNAINLSEISLIGVYGSSASRRALIRMPTGRFIKVKVGDRFDGGTIAAIGDSEVSYVKRGKTILLKMVKKG